MRQGELQALNGLVAGLLAQKYERLSTVQARQQQVNDNLVLLEQRIRESKAGLDDALVREALKEKAGMLCVVHKSLCEQVRDWTQAHLAYLTLREHITTSDDAEVCCHPLTPTPPPALPSSAGPRDAPWY